MSNGTFTAYAPPLLFGPWTEAISGLGIQANVRLDVSPEGDTTLFGEVRYFNRSGDQVVQSFQGIALIETNEGFQNVEVRFKGVPTGSAVAGTWTT